AFLLFVHPVHHIRHPACAAFDAAKAKVGKQLEDSFEHHADELADLRERVLQRMGHSEIRRAVETQRGHAQTAVGGNRYVQFLRLLPQRIKLRRAVKSTVGSHRWQHGADHTEIIDGAPELLSRFAYILYRQQGNPDESGAYFHEFIVKPIIVSTSHSDRPIFVLNRGVRESLCWIENRQLDLVLVKKVEPVICFRAFAASSPTAFLT